MDPVARGVDELHDDAALDRELGALLNVDPSPELLARVRVHVAAQPRASRWSAPWVLAAGAACGLILVAVMVMPPSERSSPGIAPAAVSGVAIAPVNRASSASRGEPAVAVRREEVPSTTALRVSSAAQTSRLRSRTEAPVLVDVHETAALRQFFADIRDGRVDPTVLPGASSDSLPSPSFVELSIATLSVPEIVIDPPPAIAYEGARQ